MAAVATQPTPIPLGGTTDAGAVNMEHVNGGATGQHAGLEAIVKANNNQDQPTVQHAQLKPDDFKVVRTLGTGCGLAAGKAPSRFCNVPKLKSLSLRPKLRLSSAAYRMLNCAYFATSTGTFARVCLVRPATASDDQENNQVFALKILRKTEVIKLKQIDHVRHEREILADVAGHPFITRLIASFSDRDSLYMVLDYVPGGELFSYLRRHRRFPEEWARFYAAEIVLVLEYLHEQQGGVAYRDLKPENLLLDAQGHVKLVDFGFAKRLGYKNDKPVETYTLCGTPEYLAPEVIQNKGHTTAVDWWALGILIYEFLTGYPPFWHQNPIEIYKQIVEKPVVFPAEPPIAHHAQHIIRSLCTVDRSRRLGNISGGSSAVKQHPFFETLDWQALYNRQIRPPIQPHVRFPGDAQCFDVYPEDDGKREPYTDELFEKYDKYFEGF